MLNKGSIVLVEFPFTDYTGEKMRPGLVISASNQEDLCIAFISSVIRNNPINSDYILYSNDKNFLNTGLKKDSMFKMNKIATVNKDLIVGELGFVSKELMRILDNKLKIAFGLR